MIGLMGKKHQAMVTNKAPIRFVDIPLSRRDAEDPLLILRACNPSSCLGDCPPGHLVNLM